jgi:hypothetical protein
MPKDKKKRVSSDMYPGRDTGLKKSKSRRDLPNLPYEGKGPLSRVKGPISEETTMGRARTNSKVDKVTGNKSQSRLKKRVTPTTKVSKPSIKVAKKFKDV